MLKAPEMTAPYFLAWLLEIIPQTHSFCPPVTVRTQGVVRAAKPRRVQAAATRRVHPCHATGEQGAAAGQAETQAAAIGAGRTSCARGCCVREESQAESARAEEAEAARCQGGR
jgi:hypothetical protein